MNKELNWRIGYRIKQLNEIDARIKELEKQKMSIATELQHLRKLRK